MQGLLNINGYTRTIMSEFNFIDFLIHAFAFIGFVVINLVVPALAIGSGVIWLEKKFFRFIDKRNAKKHAA